MENNYSDILVSIVIPIYNVESYLRQCIDSVMNQTHRNLDIILVDDGSTDSSGRIADEYAQADSRITVVHKMNGGLSDARNVGTSIAKGDYLFYLDSDDYIDPSAIERLLHVAKSGDCDIVQGSFYYLYSDHLLFDKRYGTSGNNPSILTKNDAMKYLLDNIKIKNFAWGKLYKKSLVIKYEFPVGKYFEDSFWQFKIINECKNYGIVNDPITYYRQREGSISCDGVNIKILDLIDGNIERTKFIKHNYPDLYPSAICSLWKSVCDICYWHGRSNKAFREKLLGIMEEYGQAFDTYLTARTEYNLIKRDLSTLMTLYHFSQRVTSRLTPSHFIITKLNK